MPELCVSHTQTHAHTHILMHMHVRMYIHNITYVRILENKKATLKSQKKKITIILPSRSQPYRRLYVRIYLSI
jgi:hypothetical protein